MTVRRNPYSFTPIIEVSEEEKRKNYAKFMEKHERLAEMMILLEQRNPWLKETIRSIRGRAERKGNLTVKQRSYITTLYVDDCVRTEADIVEQQEIRKLNYRLLETHLGRMRNFVSSVLYNTKDRPYSAAQMRGIRNIAKRKEKELSELPEIPDEYFDGWFVNDRWTELANNGDILNSYGIEGIV